MGRASLWQFMRPVRIFENIVIQACEFVNKSLPLLYFRESQLAAHIEAGLGARRGWLLEQKISTVNEP